jgi:hypothetical protein
MQSDLTPESKSVELAELAVAETTLDELSATLDSLLSSTEDNYEIRVNSFINILQKINISEFHVNRLKLQRIIGRYELEQVEFFLKIMGRLNVQDNFFVISTLTDVLQDEIRRRQEPQPQVREISPEQRRLNSCFSKIRDKACELGSRGHVQARETANMLAVDLQKLSDNFFAKNRECPRVFARGCYWAIRGAETVLDQHRGFNRIFNAIDSICGFICNIFNTPLSQNRYSYFRPRTASQIILDETERAITQTVESTTQLQQGSMQ